MVAVLRLRTQRVGGCHVKTSRWPDAVLLMYFLTFARDWEWTENGGRQERGSTDKGEDRRVDEMQPTDDLVVGIERYLEAQQSAPGDVWTQDDDLLLFHLGAAIDAAHRKGYSEQLLHTVLKAFFPRPSAR
jgi:hypothetical protein